MKAYGDGAPRQRLEVEHRGPSLEMILEELARRRLAKSDQRLLPPPIEEKV